MVTVPAHSFCAPARAKLIAAARDMPGVCGVLVSRSRPLTTRTPLVRQSCLVLSVISTSLAAQVPAIDLPRKSALGDIYAAMIGQCKRARAEAVSDAVAFARRGMEELVRLQQPPRQALGMVRPQQGLEDMAVARPTGTTE